MADQNDDNIEDDAGRIPPGTGVLCLAGVLLFCVGMFLGLSTGRGL